MAIRPIQYYGNATVTPVFGARVGYATDVVVVTYGAFASRTFRGEEAYLDACNFAKEHAGD